MSLNSIEVADHTDPSSQMWNEASYKNHKSKRFQSFGEHNEVNTKASELVAGIHDGLKKSGYPKGDLQTLLVRLVTCLFADDIGIFGTSTKFRDLLIDRTTADGAETGVLLNRIFEMLNTPETQRPAGLDEDLGALPYIGRGLFEGTLTTAHFDSPLRIKLFDAFELDWSKISPAIFGALLQSVMDRSRRRAIGAHYTTEQNILKVIGPLFLDDLKEEFARICRLKRNRRTRLHRFQQKLRTLTFLDPACGCGDFLIIAYRELRTLETEVLKQLIGPLDLDVQHLSVVDVDQFYGIELEELPARIAETALWMMDHIMNDRIGETFGIVYTRILRPTESHIVCGDALEMDWGELLPTRKCSYILGNPPFLGAKAQSAAQREQVHRIAGLGRIKGTLDYVCCWLLKSAAYIEGGTRIGLVATNSITQGEQVGQLWPLLFDRYGLEISFAHSTFTWTSETSGAAHVHVVIVGLVQRNHEPDTKRLFTYSNRDGQPEESQHKKISPYLAPELERFPYLTVQASRRPINGFAPLKTGSKPIDDGNYIFKSEAERDQFLEVEPGAAEFIQPYVGSHDLIHGTRRYILALQDATPDELAKLPETRKRIHRVREFRLKSRSKPTLKLADTPRQYHINVIPESPYLVVPVTSSERREYIPIGWLEPPVIPNVDTRILLDATLGDFAVLTSRMHMVWLRYVGGRLESRYRYSIALVYNTFPPPEGRLDRLNDHALAILDERARYRHLPFARLYDPDCMPEGLRAAHEKLDGAIERLYRKSPFQSDRERIEHLFGCYERMVNPC